MAHNIGNVRGRLASTSTKNVFKTWGNIEAKASCRRPPKYKKCKNTKNVKNENRQKHIILEGSRQNGLHHWIQRIL